MIDIDKTIEKTSELLGLTEEEQKATEPAVRAFAEFLNLLFENSTPKQNTDK